MIITSKELLLRILGIIDYQGDAEKFVQEFSNNVYADALLNIVDTLEDNKREEIFDAIEMHYTQPHDLHGLLTKYFSKAELDKELQKASMSHIDGLLLDLHDQMNDQQRTQISELLDKVFEKEQHTVMTPTGIEPMLPD